MENNNSDKSFSEWVKTHRKKKGWTVKEFAAYLGGVPLSYITRIEVYGDIPAPQFISRISGL